MNLTEKQAAIEKLQARVKRFRAHGILPETIKRVQEQIEYIESTYRDDTYELTPKRPLSEIPVIEGKEVRIGEKGEG